MSYEIFTISGSPRGWRVMLACLLKGVDFSVRVLNFSEGDLKSNEFGALNPRRRVPVLRDGDFVLTESIAILEYLERRHPTPALIDPDPRRAGETWRIAMEGDHDLRDASHALLAPILFRNADASDPAVREAGEKVHAEHARLEALLRGSQWLAGDARPASSRPSAFPTSVSSDAR